MAKKERKRRTWRREAADSAGEVGSEAVFGGCCLVDVTIAMAFLAMAGIIPLLMR